MSRTPFLMLLAVTFCLLIHRSKCDVPDEVKASLIKFLMRLSGTTGKLDPSFGWNLTTDPCQDHWKGVTCSNIPAVRKISLRSSNFSGVFDASSLCTLRPLSTSLTIIDIDDNNITGLLPSEISDCEHLTHLFIGHNQFSGQLPYSLANLPNLKRIDFSYNQFSGTLPAGLSKISSLVSFLAQNNQLTGEIPEFNFSNMKQFNVSYNNFSGSIPDGMRQFNRSSFIGNPRLCGPPLDKTCNSTGPAPSPDSNQANGVSKHQTFVACALMSLVMLLFLR